MVRKAVEEMDQLMEELSEFGAADTEPETEWHGVLARTIAGKDPKVPETSRQWSLYSGVHGVPRAAERLMEKAKAVVALIRQIPVGEFGPVREYLNDYCWRSNG